MSARSDVPSLTVAGVALRALIVALTLGTAYIHSTLGGLLFTLNATGYLVAAIAMIVPLGLAIRFRWVVRLGLMGYATSTIVGWALMGPYYTTAYVAKAIELTLIAVLFVDFWRADGRPTRKVRSEIAKAVALLSGRRPSLAGA